MGFSVRTASLCAKAAFFSGEHSTGFDPLCPERWRSRRGARGVGTADACLLGQAPRPKRTSLQRLARHFNIDVENIRQLP